MRIFIVFTVLVMGLSACDSSNSIITDPIPNQLKTLITQDADSEASAIGDAVNLQNDINALFDGVDPVEVETGDNIQDVINRAEGS